MSLINDMLQDLEARDVKTPLSSVQDRSSRSSSRRLVAAVGLSGILVGALLFYHLTSNSSPEAGELSTGTGFEYRQPGPGASVESASESAATAVASPARAQPLRASLAPARERGASENEQARTIDPAIQKPAPPTAALPSISESSSSDQAETDRLGSLSTGHAERTPGAPPVENAGPELRQSERSAPTVSASGNSASNQADSAGVHPREPAASSAPNDESGASRIVVQASGTGLEDDPLDPARRALSRGQAGLAIGRLEDLLGQQPGMIDARILLARTLIASRRPQRAAQVLSEGLARSPDSHELAFWLARNQLEHGQVETALETLQSHSPPVEEAVDYSLLLGAVLRRLERHESAFQVYQRISASSPGNAQGWLGLALSAEALERVAEARRAYERAVESGDARTALFAQQRLNVLAADQSSN